MTPGEREIAEGLDAALRWPKKGHWNKAICKKTKQPHDFEQSELIELGTTDRRTGEKVVFVRYHDLKCKDCGKKEMLFIKVKQDGQQ